MSLVLATDENREHGIGKTIDTKSLLREKLKERREKEGVIYLATGDLDYIDYELINEFNSPDVTIKFKDIIHEPFHYYNPYYYGIDTGVILSNSTYATACSNEICIGFIPYKLLSGSYYSVNQASTITFTIESEEDRISIMTDTQRSTDSFLEKAISGMRRVMAKELFDVNSVNPKMTLDEFKKIRTKSCVTIEDFIIKERYE